MSPDRLPAQVLASLDSARGKLHLSPVSVWELSLLIAKRGLIFDLPLDEWIQLVFERFELQATDVNLSAALEFDRVRLPHRDPSDRLLVATARVYGLTLVTADQRLLDSKACSMLKAV